MNLQPLYSYNTAKFKVGHTYESVYGYGSMQIISKTQPYDVWMYDVIINRRSERTYLINLTVFIDIIRRMTNKIIHEPDLKVNDTFSFSEADEETTFKILQVNYIPPKVSRTNYLSPLLSYASSMIWGENKNEFIHENTVFVKETKTSTRHANESEHNMIALGYKPDVKIGESDTIAKKQGWGYRRPKKSNKRRIYHKKKTNRRRIQYK